MLQFKNYIIDGDHSVKIPRGERILLKNTDELPILINIFTHTNKRHETKVLFVHKKYTH